MVIMRLLSLVLSLSLILCACSKVQSPPAAKKPNIVVILTDQERYPAHWPSGWAEKNLPSMVRLKEHGLSFERAYTSASMCSPSRAVLMTSEYSAVNRVGQTLTPDGLPSMRELMNIGALLSEQGGYEVVWKGKWHLSRPVSGGVSWSEQDIAHLENRYGISEWNPPDAGNAIQQFSTLANGTVFEGLPTLGGGYANNDLRFVSGTNDSKQTPGFGESILEYLRSVVSKPEKERKPFCLFISFVNPHDVWVYPSSWEEAGYQREEFEGMGIGLPNNLKDDLKTKPSVQLKARKAYDALAPLKNQRAQKEYVNFYAYLHKVVDQHIQTVLDALESSGLIEDTIIIRTADHGELGLSHGMREKAYTVYEEMIHIPLVISNPKLFPSPKTTEAFYSHLDLFPTLAELGGVPHFSSYGKGVSVVPVIKDPSASVQDSILFAYDDVFFLPPDIPGGHIRAIREGEWSYAVYFSKDGKHVEYEMYDLSKDPGQLDNLLYGKVSPQMAAKAQELHAKLKEKIDASDANAF
jgi:arylsulfatase A-like enzyme